MLSPILVRAADRLTNALTGLACAVGRFGTENPILDEPAEAARTLLHRLTLLVIRLVRLSNHPLPTPRQPGDPASPTADPELRDEPGPGRGPVFCLPRRSGWLFALLPDDAPVLAAALRDALADPALLLLFAVAPTLVRDLRPVLRALGLDASFTPAVPPPRPRPPRPQPPGSPSPCFPSPGSPSPNLPSPGAPSFHPPPPPALAPNRASHPTPSHA